MSRVFFLRISSHIIKIQSMDGSFNKFSSFTNFEEAINFVRLQLEHCKVTLSMNHINFYLVKIDLSFHSLFHPTTSQCQLIPFLLDKNIFAFLFVLLHEYHKFCIRIDLLEVVLTRLLDIIVQPMYLLGLEMLVH